MDIASYVSERYMKEYGERIDEMKRHKLLYLTQRECLIQSGEPPMFEATFHAWKHAREGYGKYEDSDVPMLEEDIRRDAEYFKQRRAMLDVLEKTGLNKGKNRIYVV